jgi:hypothetical protein
MVMKSNICKLGDQDDKATRANEPRTHDATHRDNVAEARRLIYYEGAGIKSTRVEALLKGTSSVPTAVSGLNSIYTTVLMEIQSAFSTRLGINFPLLQMLVPDIMHEFELGVWKDFLVHLVRLLGARGSAAVATFNTR